MSEEKEKKEVVIRDARPTVNENIEILIPVTAIQPDVLAGSYGAAWKCTYPGFVDDYLDKWLVSQPSYSDRWSHYFIALLHLREGKLEKHKKFPQATHEVQVMALDHRYLVCVNARPNVETVLFASQWYCVSDEKAQLAVEDAVCDMCVGKLNPVTSEKDEWVMRFGGEYLDPEVPCTSYVLSDNEIN